eukprot:CAMPEP_0184299152 /NCGR_PEP_ID=MMETSP1049-20130417/9818_1 /TAXON_ID=77928 /ORGANISM="Proteomonas sulcata, Strain CCMP704" /LENGTH=150 /DNA_ID=CAMNT_0026609509 /DNA_START=242 /DNA_END=691 /DNA_ORIENTATION=+
MDSTVGVYRVFEGGHQKISALVGHMGWVRCLLGIQPDQGSEGDGWLEVSGLEGLRGPEGVRAEGWKGIHVVSGSNDCTIKVWRLPKFRHEEWECYKTLRGHSGAVLSVILHNNFLISGSADRTIRLWSFTAEGSTWECTQILDGHSEGVW